MDTRIQNLSVLSLDRADLQEIGVDSTQLDDATLAHLASKVGDALMLDFWEVLKTLAEEYELPRVNSANS